MKKRLYFIIPFMAILLSGIVTNCTTEHPDLDVLVGADFMIHTNQVSFNNDPAASADALFTDLDGTIVTLDGPDAAKVYDMSGNKDFKIQGGKLGLLLDPNAPFSANKQSYTVNFTVTKAGYLSQTVNVTFNADQRDEYTIVTLVKTSALPAGVDTESDSSGTISSGTLTNAVIVGTTPTSGDVTTTTVSIPSGTIMADENGNTITASGALTVDVVSFTGTDEGTALIPGGTLLIDAVDFRDGTANPVDEGQMVVGGFASIKMRVGSTEVTQFKGNKVNVNLTLDKGAINPITDEEYKAGEELEIWSFSDSEGQWKYEATQVLTDVDADGQMEALFQTDHLTYFMAGKVVKKGFCRKPGFKVQWSGVNATSPVSAAFKVAYAEKAGTTWKQRCFYFVGNLFDGATVAFTKAPKYGSLVTIVNIDALSTVYSGFFSKGALCSGGTLVISSNPPVTNPTIACTYTARCKNGTIVFPPVGCTTYAMEQGTTTWKKIYTVDAANRNSLVFNTNKLVAGKKYRFRTYTGTSELGVQNWPLVASEYYTIFDGFHLDFVINNPACK